MCRFCVFQHFLFHCKGKKSTVKLCSFMSRWAVCLRLHPSCLASEQFLCLADTSSLARLPADFTTDLNLPGIIVFSAFIRRFHVRIVSTATAAVFTKCLSVFYLEEFKILFAKLNLHCFIFIFSVKPYVFCQRNKLLEIEASTS